MGIIKDKICVITGADCEIGMEVARKALDEGACVSVVGMDMQKLKKLEKLENGKK